MTATVLYMSMSLDGYIDGPKFREAVPISEVRHSTAKALQPMSITTVLAAVPSSTQNDDAPRS